MEYLRVDFPKERKVLADKSKVGSTNVLLLLERGKHEISLSGNGYCPESIVVTLSGTSRRKPKIIVFKETSGEEEIPDEA